MTDLNFLPSSPGRNRLAVLLLGALGLTAAGFFFIGKIPPRQLSVISTAITTPTPVLWTIESKIAEAHQLLADVKLKVGTQDISYTEDRISQDPATGQTTVTTRTFKEPEKEIALAALDTKTGEISIIRIIKRGADLIVPDGWNISILERPNGIRWNSWNTAYRVEKPDNKIIIANVYPDRDTPSSDIDYYFYSPYSPDIHTPDLITAGTQYLHSVVAQAFADLTAADVPSAAVSGSSVAAVWQPHTEFFEHIPYLEQTDLTEFMIDPQSTVDRINVIIGANQSLAFANTCNSSSACGWVQFTPQTYKQIVKQYPKANLIKDFTEGAKDHLNSMKAAILLYDTNLTSLIAANGQSVLKDPRLEEYLAASYNGSPTRAHKSLAAAIIGGIQDWINALTSKKGGLANETKGYLVKLRWLQEHGN